MQLTITLV